MLPARRLAASALGLRRFSDQPRSAAEVAKKAAEEAKAALGDKLGAAQSLASGTFTEFVKGTGLGAGEKGEGKTETGTETGTEAGAGAAGAETGSSGAGADASSSSSSSSSSTSSSGFASKLSALARSAAAELKAAVSDAPQTHSALRGASAKASDLQMSSESALVVDRRADENEGGGDAAWRRALSSYAQALKSHPVFNKLADPVVSRSRDAAEHLRERWETSDSPLVHRIQDAKESWFQESEAARALREIRSRDADFDVVGFLRRVRHDVPLVIRAYLLGDEAVLVPFCSTEMAERLVGIVRATQAAGHHPDPTILDHSEVELVDLKIAEDGSPVAILQFTCQQINCTRDSHGNVVEGAPDEVHRVYYLWALSQEDHPYVGEDGQVHPPRWQLREMLIRGMHHLL